MDSVITAYRSPESYAYKLGNALKTHVRCSCFCHTLQAAVYVSYLYVILNYLNCSIITDIEQFFIDNINLLLIYKNKVSNSCYSEFHAIAGNLQTTKEHLTVA